MQKLYIATTNQGKIKEIRAALGGSELIPLEIDFDDLESDLMRHGVSDMVTVSKAKAVAAFDNMKQQGLEEFPVIVDDAGIYLERLGGAPGIGTKDFVRNYGGLTGVKETVVEGESAYFQNVLSYMDGRLEKPKSFLGKVGGHLSVKDDAAEIEKGFPLNHLFIPDGYGDFMYKIPLYERLKFSHRFRAAVLLGEYLESLENETRALLADGHRYR